MDQLLEGFASISDSDKDFVEVGAKLQKLLQFTDI